MARTVTPLLQSLLQRLGVPDEDTLWVATGRGGQDRLGMTLGGMVDEAARLENVVLNELDRVNAAVARELDKEGIQAGFPCDPTWILSHAQKMADAQQRLEQVIRTITDLAPAYRLVCDGQ